MIAAALLVAASLSAPRPARKPPGKRHAKPAAAKVVEAPQPPIVHGFERAVPPAHAKGRATVRCVAGGRAFLDAGAKDGLAAGQTVELTRNGRPAGSCTLDAVADHQASCAAPAAREGDLTAVATPPPPPPPPRALPPPPSPGELAARREAVAAAPAEVVVFKGAPAGAPLTTGPRRGEASFTHGTWASAGFKPWQAERFDGTVRDAEVGAGFTASLDLAADHWTRQSPGERFRPGKPDQLFVWQAELDRRLPDSALALAVGRIWPMHIPGATVFDGAQVGWRSGTSEAGVYGGGIPTAISLSPSLTTATGGAYASAQQSAGPLRLVREEARLAFVSLGSLGTRAEAEALFQAWLGRRFDLAAQARAGFGALAAPNHLDVARVDAHLQPAEALRLDGGFRYGGAPLAALQYWPLAGGGSPYRAADGSIAWDASSFFTVSATGGWMFDPVGRVGGAWVGPELALRRPWHRLGASTGYTENLGWQSGRTLWLMLDGRPLDALDLGTRLAWLQADRIGLQSNEFGLWAFASARLNRWLDFRLSMLSRLSNLGGNRGPPDQAGLTFDASLAGVY